MRLVPFFSFKKTASDCCFSALLKPKIATELSKNSGKKTAKSGRIELEIMSRDLGSFLSLCARKKCSAGGLRRGLLVALEAGDLGVELADLLRELLHLRGEAELEKCWQNCLQELREILHNSN